METTSAAAAMATIARCRLTYLLKVEYKNRRVKTVEQKTRLQTKETSKLTGEYRNISKERSTTAATAAATLFVDSASNILSLFR
jgi:hypothetical protein